MNALEEKVLDRHGADESPLPGDGHCPIDASTAREVTKKELTLPAMLASIPRAMEFSNRFLEEQGFSPKVQIKLAMLIDEIISNIAKFAYGTSEGDVTVQLAADRNGRLVEISFFDEGVAFSLLDAPPVEAESAVANRKIGAQGIVIVKNLADEIEYERKDGKNVLRVCVFVGHQSERSG